jgi:hypothetical protein
MARQRRQFAADPLLQHKRGERQTLVIAALFRRAARMFTTSAGNTFTRTGCFASVTARRKRPMRCPSPCNCFRTNTSFALFVNVNGSFNSNTAWCDSPTSDGCPRPSLLPIKRLLDGPALLIEVGGRIRQNQIARRRDPRVEEANLKLAQMQIAIVLPARSVLGKEASARTSSRTAVISGNGDPAVMV